MSKHVIRFSGHAPIPGRARYSPFLRYVLDALVDGCQQATRLRLEGRSTAPGTVPAWLEQAASFLVLGIDTDELVLDASPLGERIDDKQWRTHAFADVDPARSSLELLEDSLEHAIVGREDSDRYDRHLIGTLESFGRLFQYGVDAIEVINGRTLRLDAAAVKEIRALRSRTPEDRQGTITGLLEMIQNSDRRFSLILPSGELVRGVATAPAIRSEHLHALFAKPVVVSGTIRYRPAGTVLRIEAEHIQEADPEEQGASSDIEAELRMLFEEGRVEEARRRVAEEIARGREEEVRVWASLLAPPTAQTRPASGRGDVEANRAWLREHRHEHRGAWVALRDGQLVDSDRSLRELRSRLRAQGVEAEVFLTKIEAASDDPTRA
ncbi:MAG TPA: hypothetical protein VLS89_03045 [Candidatus Nanopelagicales bacterium]|nr:hypothetical protein [Candidatus Nanopelagicales bacterium]